MLRMGEGAGNGRRGSHCGGTWPWLQYSRFVRRSENWTSPKHSYTAQRQEEQTEQVKTTTIPYNLHCSAPTVTRTAATWEIETDFHGKNLVKILHFCQTTEVFRDMKKPMKLRWKGNSNLWRQATIKTKSSHRHETGPSPVWKAGLNPTPKSTLNHSASFLILVWEWSKKRHTYCGVGYKVPHTEAWDPPVTAAKAAASCEAVMVPAPAPPPPAELRGLTGSRSSSSDIWSSEYVPEIHQLSTWNPQCFSNTGSERVVCFREGAFLLCWPWLALLFVETIFDRRDLPVSEAREKVFDTPTLRQFLESETPKSNCGHKTKAFTNCERGFPWFYLVQTQRSLQLLLWLFLHWQ